MWFGGSENLVCELQEPPNLEPRMHPDKTLVTNRTADSLNKQERHQRNDPWWLCRHTENYWVSRNFEGPQCILNIFHENKTGTLGNSKPVWTAKAELLSTQDVTRVATQDKTARRFTQNWWRNKDRKTTRRLGFARSDTQCFRTNLFPLQIVNSLFKTERCPTVTTKRWSVREYNSLNSSRRNHSQLVSFSSSLEDHMRNATKGKNRLTLKWRTLATNSNYLISLTIQQPQRSLDLPAF